MAPTTTLDLATTRNLSGWSVSEVAAYARVPRKDVVAFERGVRDPHRPVMLDRLYEAFQDSSRVCAYRANQAAAAEMRAAFEDAVVEELLAGVEPVASS